MTFRRRLTFLLWSLVATLTGLLMLIYFFFLTLVFVLKWLSLLWEILIVSISIDFSLNSKQDAPFHCIAYDYSRADWDGLRDHLRDVLGEDIFNSVLLLLLVKFVSGFRLELLYISLIIYMWSNLTHLHGFQRLVLLP